MQVKVYGTAIPFWNGVIRHVFYWHLLPANARLIYDIPEKASSWPPESMKNVIHQAPFHTTFWGKYHDIQPYPPHFEGFSGF